MGPNYLAIENIVRSSNLSLMDQDEYLLVLGKAQDEMLAVLLPLLQDDPSWLLKLSQNAKAKHSAMSAGNTEAWEKIVKAEVTQLEGL